MTILNLWHLLRFLLWPNSVHLYVSSTFVENNVYILFACLNLYNISTYLISTLTVNIFVFLIDLFKFLLEVQVFAFYSIYLKTVLLDS